MRRIQSKQITGNEVLAKDIYTRSGVILISAGTVLKKEYIGKLQELGITDIFVQDEISKEISLEQITEEKIGYQCMEQVRTMIEKF